MKVFFLETFIIKRYCPKTVFLGQQWYNFGGVLETLAEKTAGPLAMTVKGLELPAYDPRASYLQAVGHTMGDTIHHSSSLNNICFLKTQLGHMEKSGVVENADDYLFKKGEDW